MLSCDDAARYIVRSSDEPEALDAAARAALDAHLADCAACREAADTQRAVSAWLRTRPADRVSPQFAARLASRLDAASGWFGIADWRVWTLRLAPVAAALAMAIFLGLDASTPTPVTLEDWTLGVSDSSSAASLLWQPGVSAESVMETMLTGELPAISDGTNNVR
jgi:hypothetical protein